jgi:hypothetical protein
MHFARTNDAELAVGNAMSQVCAGGHGDRAEVDRNSLATGPCAVVERRLCEKLGLRTGNRGGMAVHGCF